MDSRKIILGKRLRYFRKRSKLSQWDLEFSLDFSPGYISRIENGEINPTKESLIQISERLELTDREQDYFFGKLFYPATDEEIEEARKEVEEYFKKKGVLAYLTDDRSRILSASNSFYKLYKLDDFDIKKLSKSSLIDIILNKYGIYDSIDKDNIVSSITIMLERFYIDCGFMIDDDEYLKNIEIINSHPIASDVWKEIISKPKIDFVQTREKRKIPFVFFGKKIEVYFSVNLLLNNRRFDIVEYHTDKLMDKILFNMF